MSKLRVKPAEHGPTPTGPNGRPTCRQCGKEVGKRKRTFCGKACVELWMVKTSPSWARIMVHGRDKGKCVRCGKTRNEWEAHHKVAVVEGGGECELDGYETLCVDCHKRETKELRKRLRKGAGENLPTPKSKGGKE